MNKELLLHYIDACKLIEETEQDIRKLKRKQKEVAQGSVKGSNTDFPYQEQHFHIEGIQYTCSDNDKLRANEILLNERKQNAEGIKSKVEAFMNTVPARIQRIIRFRYFEGLSWNEAAELMGKKSTGESIRKEFENFMKKLK